MVRECHQFPQCCMVVWSVETALMPLLCMAWRFLMACTPVKQIDEHSGCELLVSELFVFPSEACSLSWRRKTRHREQLTYFVERLSPMGAVVVSAMGDTIRFQATSNEAGRAQQKNAAGCLSKREADKQLQPMQSVPTESVAGLGLVLFSTCPQQYHPGTIHTCFGVRITQGMLCRMTSLARVWCSMR